MTLAETQALFHEAITSPGPLSAGRLEACFAGTPGLPAVERVAIYAGMYRARLAEALRQSFPDLARLLGDELDGLAEDYLRRHPSAHHDLAQLGRHLPAFLRRHPDPDRPWLADLAALEWARQAAFFAPPADALALEAFAGLDAGAFAAARLALAPSLRLLRLEHEVAPAWRRLEDGEPPGPVAPAAAALAVWRRGFEVVHAALPPDEADALERALAGEPLAEVCAAFAERHDAAAAAHAALASWLAEGWVAGVG